ncbi:MAG: DNA-directed RNA polymerase subunit beta [Minisyncoccia bacterium]
MKIKNFSKSQLSFPIPFLLSTQLENWKKFCDNDLKELFEEFFPIYDYTGKKFRLDFVSIRFDKPKYKNSLEAKENNDTFSAPLRAKFRLVNLKTEEIKEQEVFLADFPLMDERGKFIINGVERVIVFQLIRAPGVFFIKKNNLTGAKIIPNRGAWLEFEIEQNDIFTVKINRQRKIEATILLKAFGVKDNEKLKRIFQDVDTGKISYIEKTLQRDNTKNQIEALLEIYQKLRPGDPVSVDAAKDFVLNMFCNFQRYDLGKVGRWRMWKRFPATNLKQKKTIEKEDRVLTLTDLIEISKQIILLQNNPKAPGDEIDHLANRRVKTFSDLCQDKLRVGLMRLERIIKDKMASLDPHQMTPLQLINPRPIMAVVQEFFATFQLSQFMDAENPLSELEHKRELVSTGPSGLTRERAGFEIRDVQPSHYGKLCPIQTPEGQNVGLINHLAAFARINEFGFLETPYFRVKNGRVTDEVVYLDSLDEEKYIIAPADVKLDENKKIIGKEIEARKNGVPEVVKPSEVDFMEVSSKQQLSIAAALIPFLQNDDANRALMGSNMQRQAVPLVLPEVPLVGTGTERNVALDSGEIIIAPEDGEIVEVDASHIKMKTKKGEILNFELLNFKRRNQYTCSHQRPIVNVGQKVKKGEPLCDGPAIKDGRLALGRNLLVAILPWRGYNYEDSILISERLVKEDILTSIHIEDFICDVRETKLGPEITTSDIPNVSEEKLKNLDEEGIIRIGAQVEPGSILVGKISPKSEKSLTAEERLLRAIFGEKAKEVKDTSLRLEHGKYGKVISVKVFSRDKGDKLEAGVIKRIQVEIAQIRKIKVGDKLSGRHGNKGVISKIVPEEEMPFLEDGTPVDIVLNPLGVVSRMNIGQILETHLGWAAQKLGYIAITPGLLGATEKDIKEELKNARLPQNGKVVLFDGQTGEPFPEEITVGYMYIMKLIHLVEDKVHARSIGPYSLITQQPLGGRAQFGGQRFGEMEVWALEGYGVAYNLQEMLTIKSDDVQGRAITYEKILKGEDIKNPNIPASFSLLLAELKSLALNVEIKF